MGLLKNLSLLNQDVFLPNLLEDWPQVPYFLVFVACHTRSLTALLSLSITFSLPRISITSKIPGLTVPPVRATLTGWAT